MVRWFLGIGKGAVLGAAAGYGAWRLGIVGGWGYLVYGAIGGIVGLLLGRPFWSHLSDPQSTVVTSVLKAIVGFGVGAGLYALFRHVAPDPELSLFGQTAQLTELGPVFGAGVGALYGAWVELDDPPPRRPPAGRRSPTAAGGAGARREPGGR